MTLQQVDYMNARRAAKPASGGANYAAREADRAQSANRARDAEMDERVREVAEAWANAAAVAEELARQLAIVRGANPDAGNVTANVTVCPVCEARRAVQRARVARYRARQKAHQEAPQCEEAPF
jgi:hypothetical protein